MLACEQALVLYNTFKTDTIARAQAKFMCLHAFAQSGIVTVETFLPCKTYICATQIKIEDPVYTKCGIHSLCKFSSVQNFVRTYVNVVSKRKIKNKQIEGWKIRFESYYFIIFHRASIRTYRGGYDRALALISRFGIQFSHGYMMKP